MIFVPRCLDVERETTYCQSSAEETSNNRQKLTVYCHKLAELIQVCLIRLLVLQVKSVL